MKKELPKTLQLNFPVMVKEDERREKEDEILKRFEVYKDYKELREEIDKIKPNEEISINRTIAMIYEIVKFEKNLKDV